MILEESRQGPLTAKIGQRYIHSRYSPQKEADQFFDNWKQKNSELKRLIIIEPGLGYLINTVCRHYNNEDIFIIFLNRDMQDFCRKTGLLSGISHMLFEDRGSDLQILADYLDTSDLRVTGVLEWPASIQVFESIWKSLKEQILKLFRIRQGNQITENHFAQRWFKNGIQNFLRYDYSRIPGENRNPIILCASGPSLERYIDIIRDRSKSYIIAALPSSLRILSEYRIAVDMVFSTDPGYYAREHLKYADEMTLVVSPISASAAPGSLQRMGFLQNSPVENFFLQEAELPRFAEMGTVAATAIDFLIRWKGNYPLFICGLDLCLSDIKMHAAPHSFEEIILEKEMRFSPGCSLFFERAYGMTDKIRDGYRFTKSMDTYQNWFSLQSFPEDIYRMAPETVPLNLPTAHDIPPSPSVKNFLTLQNFQYPDLKSRKERVSIFLKRLQSDLLQYRQGKENSDFLKSVYRALALKPTDCDTLFRMSEKWSRL